MNKEVNFDKLISNCMSSKKCPCEFKKECNECLSFVNDMPSDVSNADIVSEFKFNS